MKYVVLSKKNQEKLLRETKNKIGATWIELATCLGIHKSMLFIYLRGDSRMPLSRYLFLVKESKCNIPYSKIVNIDNKPNNPYLPQKMNTLLAEFLGVLAGDGHVTPVKYLIDICADKDLDKHFIEQHVPSLFKSLFEVTPRIYTIDNRTACRMYSKKLVFHIHKRFQVPFGNKMGQLHIQKEILRNKKFLTAYLRGLFDTDGSIYQHHKTDAAIEYSSGDPCFLKQIHKALISLGFSASIAQTGVRLYSKRDIRNFFEKIKPSNRKHQDKYQAYIQTKKVPKTKDLLKGKR